MCQLFSLIWEIAYDLILGQEPPFNTPDTGHSLARFLRGLEKYQAESTVPVKAAPSASSPVR